jgi:diguanylate cyclase (GGDEF)-like protein
MSGLPGDFTADVDDQELLRLIWRDDLTGLFNRRFFARFMKQEADWGPGAEPLALAMIDMDNLKRINDRLGHMAGDASLKRIGELFLERAGEKVYSVRYAGDEFCLILPGTRRDAAIAVCEELRKAVNDDPFEAANLPEGLHPSLSVGVAVFPDDAPNGGDDLTEAADKALYHSKRTGKNKVSSAHALGDGAVVSDLEALSGFPSKRLIGREPAFQAVDEAVSAAVDGKGALLLVEGEPGAGKTRLLAELGRYAKERELTVLLEKCSAAGRDEPYRALTSILDAALRARPQLLERVASELGPAQRAALRPLLPALERAPSGTSRAPKGPGGGPGGGPGAPVSTRTPPKQARPGPGSQAASPQASASGRFQTLPGNPAGPSRPPSAATPATGPLTPPKGHPRPAQPGATSPSDSGPIARARKSAPTPPPTGHAGPGKRLGSGSERRQPPGSASGGDRPAPGSVAGPSSGPAKRPGAQSDRLSQSGEHRPSAGQSDRLSQSGEHRPPAGQSDRLSQSGEHKPPAGQSDRLSQSGERGPRPATGRVPPTRPDSSTGSSTGSSDGFVDSAETTAAVFTGLLSVLSSIARVKPLVLALDDAEHADEATLEVLARAVARPGRLLVVVAARAGAALASDPERDAPWVSFRAELDGRPNVLRAPLGPLSRDHVARLAGALLDGFRPTPAFVERVHQVTKGNPLFVEGLLRHLVDTRALVKVADGWRAEREVPTDLPLTLDDLLRSRLKVVSPELAALVAEAAVVGPAFEFEVLRAATGKREGEALELVGGAVKARLLVETGGAPGPDLALAPGVGEAAYQGMAPGARADAHRRVGEALEARGDAEKAPATLAFHFGRAGDREKRDRFAAAVREKKELIFDRDAVEGLGDGRRPRIPEVGEPAPQPLVELLPRLAGALSGAAKVVKSHAPESKVYQDAIQELVESLAACHGHAPAFTVSHRGNALTLNGRPVDKAHGEGTAQEAVSQLYRLNSIKSLTFVDPPEARELVALLSEAAGRTVQVALERYFWSVFAADHDLRRLGVVQKTLVLQRQHGLQAERPKVDGRVAEREPKLVGQVLQFLGASLEAARRYAPTPGAGSLADLDRALRGLFLHAPALVVHEGEDDALVVNGTPLQASAFPGGETVLKTLREQRLRGMVVGKDVAPQELARFVGAAARLPREWGAKDAAVDPVAAIARDASFPNVLVGDALLQLARDLLVGPTAAPTPEGGDAADASATLATDGPRAYVVPPEEMDMAPVTFRDPDLPAEFEWPSDAMAQRAFSLTKKTPTELLGSPAAAEYTEVLEALLSEQRLPLAWRLVDRLSTAFASSDAGERRRAADHMLGLAKRGSVELRAAFVAIAARRLSDAITIESDPECFERLAECARVAILDRCADGDWDVAARFVWALGRRKRAADVRLEKVGRRVLAEVVEDPRLERLFETIESGSQQERRRAARVIEGMGAVAVERLVRALKTTTRGRVEAFLIDMLAALAPDSDAALQREVTPFSDPEQTLRLLRAAAVVCRDPVPVLVAGLQHQDGRVQTEAVTVARSAGGKVAPAVLRWALQQGSAQAQLAAVQHLGELARPDAVDELLDLLNRSSFVEVQRECCLAIGKLGRTAGEKVVPAMTNVLRAGGLLTSGYPEDVRAAAAWALGQTKTADARKALEKALDDKNPRVRLTAKLALEGKA